MRNIHFALRLLGEAQRRYDSPEWAVAGLAPRTWTGAFGDGGEWMRRAMAILRQAAPSTATPDFAWLGGVKYALACTSALIVVGCAMSLHFIPVLIFCIPAFYAVEVQMLFLFPLALDHSRGPFVESPVWTQRAGGTLAAMQTVLVLASVMLSGGFLGKGFIRSWCLGCLAVLIWYEALRAKGGEC